MQLWVILSSLTLTYISSAQLTEVKHYRLLRNWVMVNQNYFSNLEVKDGAVFQRQGSMSSTCRTILCCWYWVEKSLQKESIPPEFRHQNDSQETGFCGVKYSHWKEIASSGGIHHMLTIHAIQGKPPTSLSVLTKERIWIAGCHPQIIHDQSGVR